MEGNSKEERNTDVLKYWAVIKTDHLTQERKDIILKEFAEQGPNWLPDTDLIHVISLIKGMTLIMPPGTIHAPITVTNCLFRGGMCWDERIFVSHILPT